MDLQLAQQLQNISDHLLVTLRFQGSTRGHSSEDVYRQYWLPLFFLLGCLGQFLLIGASLGHVRRTSWTPVHLFVVNLAVAKVFILPSFAFQYFGEGPFQWASGTWTCKFIQVVSSIDVVVSPFVTHLLALDRCLVNWETDSNSGSLVTNAKGATRIIKTVWLVAFTQAIFYGIFAVQDEFTHFGYLEKRCIMMWPEVTSPYLEYFLHFAFLFPYATALVFYLIALLGAALKRCESRDHQAYPPLLASLDEMDGKRKPDVNPLALAMLFVTFAFTLPGIVTFYSYSVHWYITALGHIDVILLPFLCFCLAKEYRKGLLELFRWKRISSRSQDTVRV